MYIQHISLNTQIHILIPQFHSIVVLINFDIEASSQIIIKVKTCSNMEMTYYILLGRTLRNSIANCK